MPFPVKEDGTDLAHGDDGARRVKRAVGLGQGEGLAAVAVAGARVGVDAAALDDGDGEDDREERVPPAALVVIAALAFAVLSGQ